MSKLKGLLPAAFMGAAVAPAAYKDLTSGLTAKMRNEKEEKEDEKIEEMKRKKEPSGSESESKTKPLNYKKGGSVSSASKRADGCAIRGKTRA
jgi:hypothetical protein